MLRDKALWKVSSPQVYLLERRITSKSPQQLFQEVGCTGLRLRDMIGCQKNSQDGSKFKLKHIEGWKPGKSYFWLEVLEKKGNRNIKSNFFFPYTKDQEILG